MIRIRAWRHEVGRSTPEAGRARTDEKILLLGTLGLLQQDQMLGGAFRAAGILTMGGSLLAGIWVLRIMAGLAEPPDRGE